MVVVYKHITIGMSGTVDENVYSSDSEAGSVSVIDGSDINRSSTCLTPKKTKNEFRCVKPYGSKHRRKSVIPTKDGITKTKSVLRRRFKASTRARREICYYGSTPNPIISNGVMHKIVADIMRDIAPDIRTTQDAKNAIHVAVESYASDLFKLSYDEIVKQGMTTLKLRHMKAARLILDRDFREGARLQMLSAHTDPREK
jgi:histone H3/H4